MQLNSCRKTMLIQVSVEITQSAVFTGCKCTIQATSMSINKKIYAQIIKMFNELANWDVRLCTLPD